MPSPQRLAHLRSLMEEAQEDFDEACASGDQQAIDEAREALDERIDEYEQCFTGAEGDDDEDEDDEDDEDDE